MSNVKGKLLQYDVCIFHACTYDCLCRSGCYCDFEKTNHEQCPLHIHPNTTALDYKVFCAYNIAHINFNNCINILNIVTLLCSACLDMSIGSSIILNNSPSATLPKSLSKSSLTWLSKSTSPSSWCLRHCKTTLAFKEENSDHFKTLYQSLCICLFINSALHSNFDIIYNGIAFCS